MRCNGCNQDVDVAELAKHMQTWHLRADIVSHELALPHFSQPVLEVVAHVDELDAAADPRVFFANVRLALAALLERYPNQPMLLTWALDLREEMAHASASAPAPASSG